MSTPALSEMTLADIAQSLHRMLDIMTSSMTVEPGTGRTRVTMEAGTLPAVTTVTSLSQLAGHPAKDTILTFEDNNLWNNSVRNRIT